LLELLVLGRRHALERPSFRTVPRAASSRSSRLAGWAT